MNNNKTYPLYDQLKPVFERHAEQSKSSTLFVFIDVWSDLSFHAVPNDKYAWSEHDRVVEQRGGYAIMAFDLARSFDDQFSKEEYGHLRNEGLSLFVTKPLINIQDRSGVIPANQERKARHKIIHGAGIGVATSDSQSNQERPDRQAFTPVIVQP